MNLCAARVLLTGCLEVRNSTLGGTSLVEHSSHKGELLCEP